MTSTEFKSTFDLLYNNISSNQSPGIDDYEKSVFLTKAQDDIVRAMLTNKTNKLAEGPNASSNRQEDLRPLVTTLNSTVGTNSDTLIVSAQYPSTIRQFPTNAFFILNEVGTIGDKQYRVVPISHLELARLQQKPYAFPLKKELWRIDTNVNSQVQILGHYGDTLDTMVYTIQYIRQPHPIIIGDIEEWENATINGYTPDSNEVKNWDVCELPEYLHQDICVRAAELAKAYYTGNLQETIALGNASATQVGVGTVPSKGQ